MFDLLTEFGLNNWEQRERGIGWETEREILLHYYWVMDMGLGNAQLNGGITDSGIDSDLHGNWFAICNAAGQKLFDTSLVKSNNSG